MPHINLDAVDVDGAIREAHEEVASDTRLGFLRKAGIAGGAVVSGGAILGALAPAALASGSGRPPASFGPGDIGILNYALTLEYLEAAFYNGATSNHLKLNHQTAEFLKVVTKDENAHVAFLKKALGSHAAKRPKFNFQGTNKHADSFKATAQVLENTGVHAYLGQAGNIKSKAYLGAAGSILTIEARHASVIGLINHGGSGIAPDGPFDTPFTAAKVLAAVGATGFIV
jgi:Ferritin-like domain